jgi:hypothetical protein
VGTLAPHANPGSKGGDVLPPRPARFHGLDLKSQSELRIAEALERAGVMFIANAIGRIGPGNNRQTREIDFLIFSKGRWGHLEVDGPPWHPPARACADHERDRLIRFHGPWPVERFAAERCYTDPDAVVVEFLALLHGPRH